MRILPRRGTGQALFQRLGAERACIAQGCAGRRAVDGLARPRARHRLRHGLRREAEAGRAPGIQFAGHHRLGRLTAIVDYNKIQSLAPTEETLGLEPFVDKWRSFRWDVVEVDGHDHLALAAALEKAPASDGTPICIMAHTTKGKGVSFMENSVLWHYRSAQGEEFEAALKELDDGR
jgi:hypothetical protein